MPKAQELADKLEKITNDLEGLGEEFVQHFPESSSLYRFVSEVSLAHQGMQTLLENFQTAQQTAKNETSVKENIMLQINDEPLYSFLEPEQKDKLAEYLVQNGAALAGPEELLSFIVKALSGMSAEQITKNLSKDFVMRMGGAAQGDTDGEFDAYTAGADHIKKMLGSEEEKAKLIGVLAKEYLRRNKEIAIKQFYKKAEL